MELNVEQQRIIFLLENKKNVFVSGSGGTGKSTIIKYATKYFQNKDMVVGVTSTTGCAATVINGTTLHSYLGIGLGQDSKEELLNKVHGTKYKVWQSLDILIIDEISMLNPDLFDKLEFIARSIRKVDLPFGGIQLLLVGDFYQLPVVKCDRFVFESEYWDYCVHRTVILTEIKRQADPSFRELLDRLRVGEGTNQDYLTLKHFSERDINSLSIQPPTKLFCKNISVDKINDDVVNERPPSEIHSYTSIVQNSTIENVVKYNIPRVVKLFKGAEVLLTINIDIMNGVVNGSRGVVTGFTSDGHPEIKLKSGQILVVEPHTWVIPGSVKQPISITQVPLKLAYAITIHKSQGMTLDSVYIDLKGVFEPGQAYVALSRVKDPRNLIVKNATPYSFFINPVVKEFYNTL